MIVVGGIYQERCRFPRWDRIFGSGLRAALALSEIARKVELHAYAPSEMVADISATLAPFGITEAFRESRVAITFNYDHPFQKGPYTPSNPPQEEPFEVEGDAVLRFGLMEGDAIVTARRAVYDPQSPKPTSFEARGSKAEQLVIIGSPQDIVALSGQSDWRQAADPETFQPSEEALRDALTRLFDSDQTLRAILVKDQLGGLTVYEGDEGILIRPYAAESYFRIGAGDIMAAGFAYAWAEENWSIREASDFAARCVAFAMEGPRLPLDRAGIAGILPAPSPPLRKLRIVGGDTLELQALAYHTQGWIKVLGGEAVLEQPVKEPHVTLLLAGETRRRDLLEHLAGVARSGPSVVYWPEAQPGEVRALFGDIVHVRDFASALYRAMRMAPR